MFSRNPLYLLPHEGLFLHILVATLTMFPDKKVISSNKMGRTGKIKSPSAPCLAQTLHLEQFC